MGSREEVLGRVAAALARAERTSRANHRYGVPADLDDVAALFAERVEDYRAVVERVPPDALAHTVAGALADSARVVVPPGLPREWLAALAGVDVAVDDGTLSAHDLDGMDAVVTGAAVGVAVTGTIVLDHGPDQGRRALSLVPDKHVCVVRESQLVGNVPEAVARLGDAGRAGRPLTWISGPSATSDIELERVEGVHGPRTLHVLLVSSTSR